MMAQPIPKATRLRWCTDHALVLMAVALFLVALISAASAQQTWYLSSDSDNESRIMYRGSQSGGVENVQISRNNGYIIWRADEPASTDVTFPAGDWSINLTKGVPNKYRSFNASVGVYDGSTSPFTAYGNYSDNFYDAQSISFTIDANSFTVNQGQWLAFKIINRETNHELSILTPGVSNITSPSGSDPYPVSELATVVLFGGGLLALVGYVGYRKKKADR